MLCRLEGRTTTVTLRDQTTNTKACVICARLTLLAAVEGSCQVGVYHSLPALRGHVFCRAAELTSSVVHQKVYTVISLQH